MPCVYQTEWQKPLPDFIQEYDCTIRQRLGALAFGKDEWFEITDDISALEAALIAHPIGDEILSKTLFAKARDTDNKGFQNHVAEIEKRIGLMLNSPPTKN